MHKKGLELIFNCHNVVCGCLTTIALDDKKSCWMKEMTFCFHNYSDLLWKQFTMFLIFNFPGSRLLVPKLHQKNLLEPCILPNKHSALLILPEIYYLKMKKCYLAIIKEYSYCSSTPSRQRWFVVINKVPR